MSYINFTNNNNVKINDTINYNQILSLINNNNNNLTTNLYLFHIKIGNILFKKISDNNSTFFNFTLAVKFLSFPTLKFNCDFYSYQKRIEINQEKNLYFENNNLKQLTYLIKETPLYILLLDNNSKKIICSTKLNIELFANEKFLNYGQEFKPPEVRKKTLFLFEPKFKEAIANIEISLLISRQYLDKKEKNYKNKNYKDLINPIQISNPQIYIVEPKVIIPEVFLNNIYDENKKEKKFDFNINNEYKKYLKNQFQTQDDNNFDLNNFINQKYYNQPKPIFLHHFSNDENNYDNNFNNELNDDESSEEKNVIYKKADKLYIDVPGKFPKEIDEIIEEKNLNIINYDKLMKDTYSKIKIQNNKNVNLNFNTNSINNNN